LFNFKYSTIIGKEGRILIFMAGGASRRAIGAIYS
jgi:hypothetical protein